MDLSRPSFVHSEQGQISSIRFHRIIGNLCESLRDGSREGDEDEENTEGEHEDAASLDIPQNCEVIQAESAVFLNVENILKRDISGASRFISTMA